MSPRSRKELAPMAARISGGAIFITLLIWLMILAGPVLVLLGVLGSFVNGWALYAFLRDRESRQAELFQVLCAAIERQVPLDSAVRSYLYDRPRLALGNFLWACRAVALFALYLFILPLYSFYRLFDGWRSFDTLVVQFARRLESGESLAEALQDVPGVACREVRLASEVGEATGALSECLRGTERERWTAAWLEVAPRLLYPFLVLMISFSVVTFLMLVIMPKYKRIFVEFGESMPLITDVLLDSWTVIELSSIPIALGVAAALMAVLAVIFSPSVRWRTPLIGQLYRWGVQGEILRTLGRLLATGQTVPHALGFLMRSTVLPEVATRRLGDATTAVESGQPLNESLNRVGLLPAPMSALLRTSEAVGTLPWALVELGDNLVARAYRVVQRLSLAVAPVLIVLVGSLVGFVVLAMFLPLIQLLTRLSA